MSNPLNEKLSFYQRAYETSSQEYKTNEKSYAENEKNLQKALFALADEFLGVDLSQEEKELLEGRFGFSFSEFDRKYSEQKQILISEQTQMENDPRTKEYLEMVITPDLDFVLKMENDETFNYLISENFHTTSFLNEPYFELFGLKYQPRFWKFKQVANKKAKEFRFETYVEMLQTWSTLRATFKSLIGDKRVEVAVKEAEAIQTKIDEIKTKIDAIPALYLEDTKTAFSKTLLLADEEKFSVFTRQEQAVSALQLRTVWKEEKENRERLADRMNAIMENITHVEQLISAAEQGLLDIHSAALSAFYQNNDPAAPVFKLIPEHEWDTLKEAFSKKGITLNERKNYEKVETKLSNEKKEELLRRYNVEEGEIFIDESLMGTTK